MGRVDNILKEMDERGQKRVPFNSYLEKVGYAIDESNDYGSESLPMEYNGTGTKYSSSTPHDDIVQQTYRDMMSGTQKMYSINKDILPVTFSTGKPNKFSETLASKFTIFLQEWGKRHPGEKLNVNDSLRKIGSDGVNSLHHSGNAVDVRAINKDYAKEIADLAYQIGFGGIYIGRQNNYFVHLDVGKSQWYSYNGKEGYVPCQRYEGPNVPWLG